MALKEGPEKNEDSKKNQPVKSDLEKVVESLKAELEAIKKNQSQPAVNVGMTGEQFQELLKETLKVAAQKHTDPEWDEAINMDQIDPDDFLQTPVKFAAPFVFWPIVEDIKQGHRIKLPHNKQKIEFKHTGMVPVKDGKTMRQNNISHYFSHSKKEVEWLRNHWLYNVSFYESDKEAMGADGIRMIKTANILQGLQNMDTIKILNMAREYGIKLNEDANVTRVELAKKMAEKQLSVEEGYTKRLVAEVTNETLVYNTLANKDKII